MWGHSHPNLAEAGKMKNNWYIWWVTTPMICIWSSSCREYHEARAEFKLVLCLVACRDEKKRAVPFLILSSLDKTTKLVSCIDLKSVSAFSCWHSERWPGVNDAQIFTLIRTDEAQTNEINVPKGSSCFSGTPPHRHFYLLLTKHGPCSYCLFILFEQDRAHAGCRHTSSYNLSRPNPKHYLTKINPSLLWLRWRLLWTLTIDLSIM